MAVNDWLRLVTSEYALAPNFNAWLSALLQFEEDTDTATDTIDNLTTLDSASGIQLDNIGSLLGISRVLPFIPQYCPNPLTDNLYRLIIKGAIASRAWNGTISGLYAITQAIFPRYVIEIHDNQDMTADIIVISGNISNEEKELIEAGYLIPKTAGVSYNYAVTNQAIFGYDEDSEFVKGYDSGLWI